MPHRTYNVVRGNDGFSLSVIDETWSGYVVETATEGLLDLLGHPCCGKGPLNRLHLDLFWFRVLNLPNRLHNRSGLVARIPLTRKEALAIRPNIAEWEDVSDDEDD